MSDLTSSSTQGARTRFGRLFTFSGGQIDQPLTLLAKPHAGDLATFSFGALARMKPGPNRPPGEPAQVSQRTFEPYEFLTDLFRQAVAAADPMKVIPGHLPPRPRGRLVVIGAGKASARMAEAVEAHYGRCEGLVITRYGYVRPCKGIEIVEAAHPVPDEAGVAATNRMLEMVQGLSPDDMVLALISGGGSALLCAPADGLALEDMKTLNAALLASGASISEMNTIRKRLSRVKGDDPSLIASGPTVGVLGPEENPPIILERQRIDLPAHVKECLFKAPASIAADDPRLTHAETRIVAAPVQSLSAAARLARKAGCDVRFLGDALECDALRQKQAKHGAFIDTSRDDVLAYMDFPRVHWTQIASTNPLERVNREIKRRADVIGIFPNDAAIIRLVGALMLETNDEWTVARRYMSLETLARVTDNPTVSLPAVAS